MSNFRIPLGLCTAPLRDRAGATVVMLAITLAGVAGAAGLGTEVASWYSVKRTMQGAADSAASSAASALAAGEPSSTFATSAKSVAATYNFVDASNATTVTVNYPPKSGGYQSSAAVEVIITQVEKPLLSAVVGFPGLKVSARAVSMADTSKAGEACVVALDPLSETSLTASGATALTFPSCSLYVNSPSASAGAMNGGASIDASNAYFVGPASPGGITAANGILTSVDPLIDPYLSATTPTFTSCDSHNYKLVGGKSATVTAGASGVYVFCNGVTLTGNSSLTLGPGTFIIDQGTLAVGGGSALTATNGTTIVLTTSNPAQSCANTKLDGGAIVSVTAPTSGALSGIAIYMDRGCTDTSASNLLNGGGSQNLVGAVYFPGEPVSYAGGSPTGGADCTQLIAWSIAFTGSSTFNNTCTGTGTRSVSLTGGRLVE